MLRPIPKKRKKDIVACKSCGDDTSFGNAIPKRQQLGFCMNCFRMWERTRGGEIPERVRNIGDRTPWDSK